MYVGDRGVTVNGEGLDKARFWSVVYPKGDSTVAP